MSNEHRINRIRIALDIAADRRKFRWDGSGLAIVAASPPAATLTVATPATDGRQLRVGDGWAGQPFEALHLSWFAQAGEWVDVEWWTDGYTPLKFAGPSTIPLVRSPRGPPAWWWA